MAKQVLILSSSPRQNSNSRVLCAQLAEGARSAGNTATILDVAELHISPCNGCEKCYQDSRCAIRDDMDTVWEHINQADVLVFASPIYFYNISAQLKLVIDRLYARYRSMRPTEAALLLTCADGESAAKPARLAYYKMVESCHLTNRGVVIGSRLWGNDDLEGHSALSAAYRLGAGL